MPYMLAHDDSESSDMFRLAACVAQVAFAVAQPSGGDAPLQAGQAELVLTGS